MDGRSDLESQIRAGQIDTVLVAFPDLNGRLVGKRITGRFFLDHVADHGTENCDYLIACDLDDNPLPGYRFASYDTGYGDMHARVDWSAVMPMPWFDRTALAICDLFDADGAPIEVAPRTILRRQVEAAAEIGFVPKMGSEFEFYLYDQTAADAHAGGYRDLRPHSRWMEDYDVQQTNNDEYVIGAIRRALEGAGIPVESSKGEAGIGQHEINLRYTTAVQMADQNTVYKHATKDLASRFGRTASFMAKPGMDMTGSSGHIHSSLWHAADDTAVFDIAALAADHDGDQTFRWFLGGQIAAARDFSLLWAPTINSYKRFQPGSWAPTAVSWGIDNRTLGLRIVGHGASSRIENRIPGSDINSYLAFAGTIAAGLHGIRNRIDPGPAFEGNGYEATDVARIPSTFVEAIELWERSEIARACFGDDVHHHLLTTARAEWRAFNATVTDWEFHRYWERI